MLCLPGKIHFIEEAGDFLRINNWLGSPAPWTGILAVAPGDGILPGAGQWRWWGPAHLPIFSSLPQPCSRDEGLRVVTFVWVIFFIVTLAGWVLGFDHQLQEIYPALRGKAGESLWWQVPWRAQISRFHSLSTIFRLRASPKCTLLPHWKT